MEVNTLVPSYTHKGAVYVCFFFLFLVEYQIFTKILIKLYQLINLYFSLPVVILCGEQIYENYSHHMIYRTRLRHMHCVSGGQFGIINEAA